MKFLKNYQIKLKFLILNIIFYLYFKTVHKNNLEDKQIIEII